jgi:hypothetical protein
MEWQPTRTAPFDRDLELAVINYDGPHAFVFPCRRILGGWVNAQTKKQVTVYPTHGASGRNLIGKFRNLQAQGRSSLTRFSVSERSRDRLAMR